jgi:steroid 5-alpha reductase family enzyme
MFSMASYFHGLLVAAAAAALLWPFSVYLRNVSIVDSLWSLLFLFQGLVYVYDATNHGELPLTSRQIALLVMLGVWALRLSIYITWRNKGHGEDRRYQAIRARNEPNFALKSLYRVFLVQAVIAWVISLPLLSAVLTAAPFGLLDAVGTLLWLVGFVFEAGGDWQLARFQANPANAGKVMDRGLWRYTRHPNYFGDCCIWWGFFAFALSAGAWWSVLSPILMSLLLLRVSGVALLEKDIGERRPQYADYIRRTPAFFPWRPK